MSILLTAQEEQSLLLLYAAANTSGVTPRDRLLLEVAVTNPLCITRKGVDYLLTKYQSQLPKDNTNGTSTH